MGAAAPPSAATSSRHADFDRGFRFVGGSCSFTVKYIFEADAQPCLRSQVFRAPLSR